MKIAVVHPYPVYSGAVGGVTRVNSLVRFLAPKHDVTVFAHSSGCPDTDAEAIIKRADCALYESKKTGRNRVSFARAA